MAGTVSVYLRDETLRRLDALVAERAAEDRANGLEGRTVTNRSRLVESIIEEYLGASKPLPLSTIEYFVVDLAKEYGAKKVSLFGSYARGEATEASDVDILLDKGDIRGLRVLDFQDELAQRLGRPVDVVTTAGAGERFLSKIKKDEVVLYEAS
ncbi:MAG: nucleotidyltransferase domain-containing protein [Slackia sp.]|nr:nucleotidyltransferase domain-containing protein [Slackia sp.]